MAKKKTTNYGNDSITSLKGPDRVRKRPGVIFGSDDIEGCTHAFFEIVSNSVDEAKAGYGDKIEISKFEDGSFEVKDYGRGLPMDWNETEGQYNWQLCLCELFAGGKLNNSSYDFSLGLNGLGAAATQYASEWFEVTSIRDGYEYFMRFEKGEPVTDLKKKRTKSKETGTTIRWKPDIEVFTEINISINRIKDILKEQAIVNPGILFSLYDEESMDTFEFFYENGIQDYISELVQEKYLTEPQLFTGEGTGRDRTDKEDYSVKAEVAFCFSNDVQLLKYFHNSSPLDYGGSPDKAVKSAMVSAFDKEIKTRGRYTAKEAKITFGDIQDSLVLVINSYSTQTSYENQTKKAINNKFIQEFLTDLIKKNMEVWFIEHKAEADKIVDQILINKRSREQSENQRITVKKKLMEKTDVTNKVKKFVDCRSKDPNERELFICEGDSALSSLLVARDPSFQALMPIRGKILNLEKASLQSTFNSDIIMDLMRVLGCGVEIRGKKMPKDIPSFDINKLKFNKVIMACFTGDTKIKALDGNSYSFKTLVDNNINNLWVYSLDNKGNMVPTLAKNIRKTRKSTEFVIITLDNNKQIKCTPDHMFMKVDGSYCRADELKKDDSLMPLHTRINSLGYEEFYDSNSSKWLLTYRRVAETINTKEMQKAEERLANEDHLPNQNGVCVHHKDFNKRNNTPENLAWKTLKEHGNIHNSKEHGQYISKLWHSGFYDDIKFGGSLNNYNGSEKHLQAIQKAKAEGKYKENNYFKNKDGYNYSEKHHEVVKEVNKSEKHILSVNRGIILNSIKYLIDNDLDFNEYNFNYYRNIGCCLYKNILNYFDSLEEAYNLALERKVNLKTYHPAYTYISYDNNQKQKKQIGNVIHKLIINNKEFNEKNYTEEKGVRTVKYENIPVWFDSYEDAYEYALNYNHTITNIEKVTENEQDVYCCTVDNYHNFLLDAGVFVKNCDSDPDGFHILCLAATMFYTLCPRLIENGYFYYVQTPLFEITDKSGKKPKTLYAYSDAEREKLIKNKDPNKLVVQRAKGLGELEVSVMNSHIDPETRRLVQVTTTDAEEMKKWFELFMGSDVDPRRQYIEEHGHEYMEGLDVS